MGVFHDGALRHRRGGLLLVLLVVLVHAALIDHLAERIVSWSTDAALPPKLQVAFVREMVAADPPEPTLLPPAAPAPPQPGPRPTGVTPGAPPAAEPVPPVETAASAPQEPPIPDPALPRETIAGAEDPSTATETATATTGPVAAPAVPVTGQAADPDAAVAGTESAPRSGKTDFRWPASTRLSYRVTGQYRGDVHGQAQVEWVLAAPRYQVNLDVQVGLPFAPLFRRQMRSDGFVDAAGLHPRLYVEDSQIAFRGRRRAELVLDDTGVTLANGMRWSAPTAAPPASAPATPAIPVQDSASQFVQLAYLFSIDPSRLRTGELIALKLALPRRVAPWVYEVGTAETLYTPFGPVETFHVYPRAGTERGHDLLVQAWFAPRWGHLPVRIRIEQDAEVFIDLMIERRPELAAPEDAPAQTVAGPAASYSDGPPSAPQASPP